MCLLGMASLAGRKQEQRPKLMPVSAAAAVPAEAERAAVALSWSAALRNCQILRLKMSKLSHVRPPRNVPEHRLLQVIGHTARWNHGGMKPCCGPETAEN